MRLIDGYNAGRLDEVLAFLDDRIAWSDCDYRNVRAVEFSGKAQAAAYLRERFAEHDRLHVPTIFNHNSDPTTAALGVQYERRTSDTLRSMGFSNGIKPALSTKVGFTDAQDRILVFANGPVGGSPALCRPSG